MQVKDEQVPGKQEVLEALSKKMHKFYLASLPALVSENSQLGYGAFAAYVDFFRFISVVFSHTRLNYAVTLMSLIQRRLHLSTIQTNTEAIIGSNWVSIVKMLSSVAIIDALFQIIGIAFLTVGLSLIFHGQKTFRRCFTASAFVGVSYAVNHALKTSLFKV